MNRDAVLHKVRLALGRTVGQPAPEPPPVLLSPRTKDPERLVASFIERFETLAGKSHRVPDARAARDWMAQFLDGRTAVASNAAYLEQCAVPDLPGVQARITDREALRAACASATIGITGADYALSETGTLVMIAGPQEARMISLLPPVHVAIFQKSSLLAGLDDLLSILPRPAEQTSSMVLITGPSRTADIEQILVRGVHGPGEIHAVIVDR